MESEFLTFLKVRLHNKRLPGCASQMQMAPKPMSDEASLRKMKAPADAKPSRVLLLLFPDENGDYKIIITLRTHSINHGGQLSLPGGHAEENETAEQTALREAKEEIGIKPKDVSIAGRLSALYVNHSKNMVTCVVGFLEYTPELAINPDEVKEAFSVPLKSLLDEKNMITEKWELSDGAFYKVPYWNVHRVPLWGATAMILSEFMELCREYNKQCSNDK